MKITILTLLSVILVSQVLSENVLVLCPISPRSHKIIIEATVESLANRNHSITIVSSFKTTIDSPNIRDIVILDGFDFFTHSNPLESRKEGVLGLFKITNKPVIDGCHATYQNPEFMKLLQETFHLVIIDAFANHCLQGFAYKLGAPVIRSTPLPTPPPFAMQLGNYLPPSFVPDPILPFDEEMNLLQRIVNFAFSKLFWLGYFSVYSQYESIYRKYLGEDVPGLNELESNFSMMFVNSHFSINRPRPTMPDIVEIGGVHCRPGKPLPKDLEEYISGAKDGVILFSLGSILKGQDMAEETRKAFVNAFSRVKQRVLWKWDSKDMTDLPPNVRLSKWLPVQDILAHPNVKLFITHGGLLSTQEAIYHGVPLVGIPVFGDQDMNVNRYVKEGIATFLEIVDVTEEDVSKAIQTILTNPAYKRKVQEMSVLFRDQPMTALDTAVFWCEYVMRHKGAPHLRSIARKLSFIQYHSLDVIAILASMLIVSLFFTIKVTKILYRKVFRRSSSISPKNKKTQ